jgi:hypothetical protein
MKEIEEELSERSIEELRRAVLSTLNCKPDEFARKYNAYKIAKAEFEELFEPVKDTIIMVHKDKPELPSSLVVGGVELTYVAPSTRSAIDSKKLKEEEPELAKKFTKVSKVSASVRVKGI